MEVAVHKSYIELFQNSLETILLGKTSKKEVHGRCFLEGLERFLQSSIFIEHLRPAINILVLLKSSDPN